MTNVIKFDKNKIENLVRRIDMIIEVFDNTLALPDMPLTTYFMPYFVNSHVLYRLICKEYRRYLSDFRTKFEDLKKDLYDKHPNAIEMTKACLSILPFYLDSSDLLDEPTGLTFPWSLGDDLFITYVIRRSAFDGVEKLYVTDILINYFSVWGLSADNIYRAHADDYDNRGKYLSKEFIDKLNAKFPELNKPLTED